MKSNLIRKYTTPKGDGNFFPTISFNKKLFIKNKKIHNSERRRKLALLLYAYMHYILIRKYTTPKGDGNRLLSLLFQFKIFSIRKYTTPKGDGNLL
mgnify:CR=1 FL=1